MLPGTIQRSKLIVSRKSSRGRGGGVGCKGGGGAGHKYDTIRYDITDMYGKMSN